MGNVSAGSYRRSDWTCNSSYHVDRMEKNGVLEFSSVILPIEYRYNKKNMHDFKIDFSEKLKNTVFKVSFMRTCTVEDHDNGTLDRSDANRNTYQNPVP